MSKYIENILSYFTKKEKYCPLMKASVKGRCIKVKNPLWNIRLKRKWLWALS